MAILKHPTTKPPGGYRYRQPETGCMMEGDSLHDLSTKVMHHRIYRRLSPTNFDTVILEVQRQICSALDEENCMPEANDPWVPAKYTGTIKVSQAIALSAVALKWLSDGKPMIPKSEADARAKICKGCMLNKSLSGCKCSLFYKMVAKAIPAERRDPDLGICSACGCGLQAKVNVPMEVIRDADQGRDIKYPAYCWAYVLPPGQ